MEKIKLSLLEAPIIACVSTNKPVETLAFRKKKYKREAFYIKARGTIYGNSANKPLKK